MQIEQIEVEELRSRLIKKKALLHPTHPDHDPDKLKELRKEVTLCEDTVDEQAFKLKKAQIHTNAKISKLKLDLQCLEKDNDVDLAQIDEEEDQFLGSDEEVDQSLEEQAQKFKEW
jgi:hypothetical protein